jgi:hypothetical protein
MTSASRGVAKTWSHLIADTVDAVQLAELVVGRGLVGTHAADAVPAAA